jgi:hypothetical protein
MRSQNNRRRTPLGPAVSTNENLEELGLGTCAFSHSAAGQALRQSAARPAGYA